VRAMKEKLIKSPIEIPERYCSEKFDIRRSDIGSDNYVLNECNLEWVL